MSTRKPTIQDIARRAQVGAGTVSRVLNDSPDVSDATRAKVLRAIEELQYRPSFAARLMRTGKSNIIGFITDEIASTPYAVDIIKGAQTAAWENNKLLLVANSNRNLDMEEHAVEALLERGAEAIIYASMYHRAISPPEVFQQLPTVLLDCFDPDQSLPSVVPDEHGAGRLAADILVQKGHERIAFINLLPDTIPAHIGRLAGFKAGLEAAGIRLEGDFLRATDNVAQGGYLDAYKLMQLPSPPTAIFCGTDRIAMGVYNALSEMQIRIPEDVAVLGFDNQVLIAEGLHPPLSTIALPHYEMGQWAIGYLLENQDNLVPVQMKMDCPYIERSSV